ncbi:MAG: plasmid replication protein RepC [Rhizobiaceae bacterium]
MSNQGWRKPTPGLSNAEKHAQVGERLSIPKNQALLAIKRVAATVGLKSGDLLLLDTLGAFTKPQDWEEGRRPIIWPSNDYLMEQTGFSLTSLRRHARRLSEFGLMAFKDSPNGKRWGHRDDAGVIVEAYGFDLAPLAARCQEFEWLHVRLKEEQNLCKGIKRKITIARRTIRAKIEIAIDTALTGVWNELLVRFQDLLSLLPRGKKSAEWLLDLFDGFNDLREKVDEEFKTANNLATSDNDSNNEDVLDSSNMVPRVTSGGTHILFTKELHLVSSNVNRKKEKNEIQNKKLPPQVEESSQSSEIEWSTKTMRTEVEIPTLMQACPEFAELARGTVNYVRTWQDVHFAADKICAMVGISRDAWNAAQKDMGPFVAAAAIALITDKHTSGEVASPGGYLRGMVEKARIGELNLARSIYGRLNERGSMH